MNNLPVVRSPWRIVILLLGFTFLYAPMLMLVIYSFNSSKLVTVWAGWSTRWYGELLRDDAMMSAVGLSLTIAACAATAAAILGTIAAVVLVRCTCTTPVLTSSATFRSVPLYMNNWKLGTDTLRGLRQ